ncbi:hypothetical protein BH09BAC1_BH09BAC1_15920 [soil metagenome]
MKIPIIFILLAGLGFLMLGTGCADRGCNDPSAENFDPFAQRNDGSCIIRGCTDPNSTSYNPQANVTDGSCTYPTPTGQVSFWSSVQCCAIEVAVDGQKIDTIEVYYTSNPGCVNGNGIVRRTLTAGNHTVNARTITGDTSQLYIWENTISITADDCLTYEFFF